MSKGSDVTDWNRFNFMLLYQQWGGRGLGFLSLSEPKVDWRLWPGLKAAAVLPESHKLSLGTYSSASLTGTKVPGFINSEVEY